MIHNIPKELVDNLTKSPSQTKITQVSNLQNYIQELLGEGYFTFLQGSYKNNTSISDINDVDIVAIRINTYSSAHSGLVLDRVIHWDTIFSEIEQKLRNQKLYKWTVSTGDKCIKIKTNNFSADIVPSVQVSRDCKIDPIAIYSFRDESEQVNFPRIHWKNGVAKHGTTSNNFKPLVRVFKNWAKNNLHDSKIAPSYHIESLVYNAPDNLFTNDYALSFVLISDHIVKKLNTRNCLPVQIFSVCGSEDITKKWPIENRQLFCNKLNISMIKAYQAIKAINSSSAELLWKESFNL